MGKHALQLHIFTQHQELDSQLQQSISIVSTFLPPWPCLPESVNNVAICCNWTLPANWPQLPPTMAIFATACEDRSNLFQLSLDSQLALFATIGQRRIDANLPKVLRCFDKTEVKLSTILQSERSRHYTPHMWSRSMSDAVRLTILKQHIVHWHAWKTPTLNHSVLSLVTFAHIASV